MSEESAQQAKDVADLRVGVASIGAKLDALTTTTTMWGERLTDKVEASKRETAQTYLLFEERIDRYQESLGGQLAELRKDYQDFKKDALGRFDLIDARWNRILGGAIVAGALAGGAGAFVTRLLGP